MKLRRTVRIRLERDDYNQLVRRAMAAGVDTTTLAHRAVIDRIWGRGESAAREIVARLRTLPADATSREINRAFGPNVTAAQLITVAAKLGVDIHEPTRPQRPDTSKPGP